MKRHEYMNASHDGDGAWKAFRAYYGQYVTAEVKQLVLRYIGMEPIRASEDKHLNDIPLRRWDSMVRHLPHQITVALRENGDWLSLGNGVCILKEAARLLREEQR